VFASIVIVSRVIDRVFAHASISHIKI